MDWEKISSARFEELCCIYANATYKSLSWEPTKHSWDGNKDGEFVLEIEPINQLIKGWYESKYTKNINQSIPRAHMDSTLVSGILDGHVVYILFITNGRITPEFRRRANAMLLPHRIEVNFVDGEMLEEWLINNPEVYQDFFESISLENCEPFSQKFTIEDVCFFDGVLSAPILMEPLKSLSVNNEYYLYIGIKSNVACKCLITTSTDGLKLYSREEAGVLKHIQVGYNSFFIKCQAHNPFSGKMIIRTEALKGKLSSIWQFDEFSIKEDNNPRIAYHAQTIVTHQMYDYLQAECSNNTILSLTGSEGSGKSFLIRKLIESLSKEQNEYLTIQFSEKKAENACSLCKLILFLNFGHLYNVSDNAFFELIESSVNLPIELFVSLRDGINNQITAMHVIQVIISLFDDKSSYALMPMYNMFMHRQVSYIFIDDVQKVDREYSQLFQELLKEFTTRQFSQIIILGCRPREFYDIALEDFIKEYSQEIWSLGQLSTQDIKDTLSQEFGISIGGLADLVNCPLNVLHLVMLIKQLKCKNLSRLDPLHATRCFAETYQKVNEQNNQFARHKVETARYPKELYLIYKIETGISKQLLYKYWETSADEIFSEMIAQNLVREINGIIYPSHDAYLYAFQRLSDKYSGYVAEIVRFLQYIQTENYNNAILKSNLISILVTEGDMSIPNIRDIALEYCKQYYATAQYSASKIIAKALLPNLSVARAEQFNDVLLEILYIYAQSVKFTEGHNNSTSLFLKLRDYAATNDVSPRSRDIGWDALSEVLNNEMWMLNFDLTTSCIKELEQLNPTSISTFYGENAYLNYLNRKMMCESFCRSDSFEDSYNLAVSESKKLKREEYVAYAKMDYARALYTIAPSQSIALLTESIDVFSKSSGYYRRLLECCSEKILLKTIIQGEDYSDLYTLQKEMLSYGYINSYAKATLKILTIELMKGIISTKNARTRLNRLVLQYPEAITNKRLSTWTNQLLSLAAYIDGDVDEKNSYCKIQYSLVSKMNDSYTKIPVHNYNVQISNKTICWCISNDLPLNSFWLDPRLW